MNSTTSSPQDSAPVTGQDAPREVLIRMYDSGFGDTFLMRIPTPDGKWLKILFDCGSIKLGSLPLNDIVKQVIEDARDAEDKIPRIDLVIATHRHRDHVSGFEKQVWNQVEVKEVWMPWTEKPEDTQAQGIRNKHLRLAQALVANTEAQLAASPAPEALDRLNAAHEIALNAMTNEGAMQTLYHGFAGQPYHKYLALSPNLTSPMTTPVLPGVFIYVLGPSSDTATILDLNPPVTQSYLKLFGTSASDGTNRPAPPFRADWVVTRQDYLENCGCLASDLPDADQRSIQKASQGLENDAAAALDAAINGTSLMLLFQIGNTSFLFPGDAQWGTWQLALNNPDARKLLGSVNFYKVGHHGSHNATPREFVEKILKDDFWAMISTNHVSSWPQVPKQELVAALSAKTKKIIETDKPLAVSNEWFNVIGKGVFEAHIPI